MARRLSRRLGHAALLALPPFAATRDSTFVAHIAIAGLFLPRARALMVRIGGEWPEQFEQATGDHLRATLDLEIPPSA